jgi:GDP-mannose 4,6-dehydratase
MKHLVTGALGSGGSYMCEHLMDHGEVRGLGRWHTSRTVPEKPAYPVHECDLMDPFRVLRLLDEIRPDIIYHLASHANVRAGFDNSAAVLRNNIDVTVNLLEAIRTLRLDTRFLLCSSSEVYGQVKPGTGPIDESYPANPVSPYAVSKLTQDAMGYAYFKSFGVQVVRTRAFTYFNPRRTDLFATSFAMQVARIEAGMQDELTHGNLDSVRTVLDVRDAVRAYRLAAERGVVGDVYNIGGTRTITVGEFLEILKGMALCEIPSREDPALVRPADVTLQIPDCTKFRNLTGWEPEIPFEQSVVHLLDHCRAQLV